MARTFASQPGARDIAQVNTDFLDLLRQGVTRVEAAHRLGRASWSALRDTFKAGGLPVSLDELPGSRVSARDEVPDSTPDIEEILLRRRREYARRDAREKARACVKIEIDDATGVIGLLVNGDEHLDNPGTRITEIERNLELVRSTPGLYAISMGDVHDAWIGRLQALYGESTTTLAEALALCEWYINGLGDRLLFAVGGNHNAAWWGDNDPLIAMMKKNGTLYLDNEVRVALHINDAEPITVFARHGWPGRSQWNAGHGTQKAAQMGVGDDILLGGHTHVSAYGLIKQPHGEKISHCIQVASFKVHDQYARDLGLRDQHISSSVLCILDPRAGANGRISVFHDVEKGVEILNVMRQLAA